MPHLVSLSTLSRGLLAELLETARALSRHPSGFREACLGRHITQVEMTPDVLFRVAVQVGMRQLGGQVFSVARDAVSSQWSGAPADLAGALGALSDGLVVSGEAAFVDAFAEAAPVPVVVGVREADTPLDALALLLTIQQLRGSLSGIRVAFVGDGAAAHELLVGGALAGMTVSIAHPRGFAPSPDIVTLAIRQAARSRGAVLVTEDPGQAVSDADVVVVDAWATRAIGGAASTVTAHFRDFRVDSALLEGAAPDVLVLHGGPVSVGLELGEDVVESARPPSQRWADNRLHAVKAALMSVFGERS